MTRSQLVGYLFAGLASLVWLAHATAGEGSETKVKASATTTKISADGKQTVTLTLVIDKGWHIYANPVGHEMFEAARTRITVKAKDKTSADVQFPAGTVHTVGKDKMNVYEGRVAIPIQVQRTAGDTSPLEISVRVNSCDDNMCLAPGTVKVTVP